MNNRFGSGIGDTVLHPFIAVALIVACILILVLPRKYVMIPVLVFMIFTPFGQHLFVGGVHVYTNRILILFGCIRMALTNLTTDDEIVPYGLNPIDKMFLAAACFMAISTVLLWMQWGAVINQVGEFWDAVGGYFLVRFTIQNKEDIVRFIKTLAGCMAVLAVTMLIETYAAVNIFGFFNGHWAVVYRDGAIRARGPLVGAIVCGTFAATALPLYLWIWAKEKSRVFAVVGIVACTIMTWTSQSSTPLLAYLAVLVGLAFWLLRKQMRIVRWGIVIMLIALHLTMKAPVWFIINHVDLIAGNSGDHRAMIIDGLIRHFNDWWLFGVKSTRDWGWDMWDQANQFVGEGENGGLITLVCFIWLISRSFGRIGTTRKLVDGDKAKEWELYLLGVMLFSYVLSFFGISFADGAEVYPWFGLFAMIGVVSTPILRSSAVTVPVEATRPYQFKSTQGMALPAQSRLLPR